ncbi:MAG: RagB/SusD family nutrient uptake outer membrane protein [Chitinophagaceae bacterium]|nr:RagB/SusD family nutrient uptake outer membrane protein [Chitinophagaceae bacterium]
MTTIYKLFLSISLLILISCNKYLDGPQPSGSIDMNKLNTLQGFQSLMNGVYNGIQNYGSQLTYYSESMTDFVNWNLSFTEARQIGYQSMTANNPQITLMWDQLYKAINDANIIIAKLDNLENTTQAQKDNLKGQAYFTRALMYYYLVQYWSKPWNSQPDNSQMGVPLMLDPVINSNDFKIKARGTVKEVYDQIDLDLKSAESLTITNNSPGKATNYAATALRARIALMQGRWLDAATLASNVIPHYSLLPDVKTFFREPLGAESIFEIVNTIGDAAGGGNYAISVVCNINGRAGITITDSYRNTVRSLITDAQKLALTANGFNAIDTRVTELLTSRAAPPLTLDKYTHTDKYEDWINLADNPPVLRLPEMILTRAEALAEQNGVNQTSIDLLNQIRTRSIKVVDQNNNPGDKSLIEFKITDFSTKEDLIDAIFREREVELSYEGLRKMDLQRKKLSVRGTPWDSNILVFPIPQSQLDASNLPQNPGY